MAASTDVVDDSSTKPLVMAMPSTPTPTPTPAVSRFIPATTSEP